MNWRAVDKRFGCWIFCHGFVGFVFKFGSNWTNFDVSTPFLMGRGGAVFVRERCVGSDIPVAYVSSRALAGASLTASSSGRAEALVTAHELRVRDTICAVF